eukprot:26081-Eustigmatos_ZCMA.PRE.1
MHKPCLTGYSAGLKIVRELSDENVQRVSAKPSTASSVHDHRTGSSRPSSRVASLHRVSLPAREIPP